MKQIAMDGVKWVRKNQLERWMKSTDTTLEWISHKCF